MQKMYDAYMAITANNLNMMRNLYTETAKAVRDLYNANTEVVKGLYKSAN